MVATFAFTAALHMVLLFTIALIKLDIRYINPVDFLGVSYVWPELANRTDYILAGWAIIFTTFFVMMYLIIHYRRYIAIVKSQSAFQKITQAARDGRKKAMKVIESVTDI